MSKRESLFSFLYGVDDYGAYIERHGERFFIERCPPWIPRRHLLRRFRCWLDCLLWSWSQRTGVFWRGEKCPCPRCQVASRGSQETT